MRCISAVTVSTLLAVLPLCGCTSSSDGQPSQSGTAPTSGSEANAPNQAESQPSGEGETEETYANTLRWKTASEVDNFGFDIYRSISEEGPFERITEEPVAGAGTTDEPQSYVWVDDAIDPSRGYHYYIESISMAGVRERFSPVVFIGPKKPAAVDTR
jgi:hypothetical protein